MPTWKIPGVAPPRWTDRIRAASWRDLTLISVPGVIVLALMAWVAIQSARLAPPSRIRFISGPDGSSYRNQADRYKKIIEAYGVKVDVLPSHGALENLQLLADPKNKIDVGFVQGGLSDGIDTSRLVSLGSVFAQPLMIYAHNDQPLETLAPLAGRRLAVGAEGSGTRVLALKLLKANDIEGPPTQLLAMTGDDAAKALLAGSIDAAFLMGDSATPQVMRSLRGVPGIELTTFRQADAYLRKFRFLSKLTLPEGAMDLAKNYPPRTLQLVGPTVELVAKQDLHPALSDLLISAAREVHGGAGMFRNAGEYPAPLARDFPHQPRRRALLQVGRAVPVQAPAVLAREPGRSPAGPDPAAVRGPAAGQPHRALAVSLARALAHLPLVRRAHGHRARRHAPAFQRRRRGGAETHRRDRPRGQRHAHAALVRRSALRAARPHRRRAPSPRGHAVRAAVNASRVAGPPVTR